MRCIKLRLRGQLLVATSILVLVPLLLIGYFVDLSVSKTMRQNTTEHNTHMGDLIQSEVLRLMGKESQSLDVAAKTGDFEDTQQRSALMHSLHKTMNNWQKIYFVDNTGKITAIFPYESVPDIDMRGQEWYQIACAKPGRSIINIYTDPLSGREVIILSEAVYGSKGKFIGVLAANIEIATFSNSLAQNLKLAPEIHVWLVEPDGHFVMTPKLPNITTQPSVYSESFLQLLKSTYIVSETTIPELGWRAFIAQDPNFALAGAKTLSSQVRWLTGFFFLGAILGILYYVDRLTKPINALLSRIHAIEQGACSFDMPPMRTSFNEIGEIAQAFDKVTEELQALLRDVISSLTMALDARDPYTRHHSERVAIFAHILARHLGWTCLTAENVLRAGLMHDVGKIAVPEYILNKPGPLTNLEYAKMKTHAEKGFEIIQGIPFYVKLGIAEMVLQHHERWDGKGYPLGLSGENIVPGARILAIADAFDAMTSDRAYRKALTLEEALAELEREAGKQFDPDMVKVFLSIPREELLECMNSSLVTHMDRVELTAV